MNYNMEVSDHGLDLIKHFEGFVGHVYKDPVGIDTIGYGHVVLPRERFAFWDGLTKAQGHDLLKKDVRRYEASVKRLIVVPLTQYQFDALVSFTFNLGGGALQRSTLRRKINRHDHRGASFEFLRWVYAGGRRLKGLVRRRKAESLLYQYV